MTRAGASKKRATDREKRPVLPKAAPMSLKDVFGGSISSKLAQRHPKRKVVKGGSTSGTTVSGEVEVNAKKMRVDSSAAVSGAKGMKSRPVKEDELLAVENRLRAKARGGTEELNTSAHLELSRVARMLKDICHGLEEGRAEFEGRAAQLEFELALDRECLVSMKDSHRVMICELTDEVQKNVDDIAAARDSLGANFSQWGTMLLTLKPLQLEAMLMRPKWKRSSRLMMALSQVQLQGWTLSLLKLI
ncbi:hypothetical protein GIB67_012633 [Kingdonia uniflora]|uniref:Uncharacterized protein n=1 Tax=Kingdonia uniflora TaxID=39325 RepID=A0A7J7NEX1_9MAGN|nr:hypothetical protein GIB67_012633 [Kingdonia uniflora]